MNVRILISFLIIYIIWGSTFTAIKYGLESFPPFLLAGMRFILAGTIFLLLAKWKDFKGFEFRDYAREFLVGLLLTLGNAGVCWSEQYMSSGAAALIVGAVPIMFMLANWLSFEKKIPHYSSIFAFFLGLVGIGLISTDNGAPVDWKVVACLLLANCLWVTGSLIIRVTKTTAGYYSRASLQTLFGGCLLVLFSTLGGERSVKWDGLSAIGVMSVAYLALAGTVLAYTAYSFLLKSVRTEITSTYALVNPLIALLFGVMFLNEPFTVKLTIAAAFIIFSVVLVLYGDKFFRKKAVVLVTTEEKEKLKQCS